METIKNILYAHNSFIIQSSYANFTVVHQTSQKATRLLMDQAENAKLQRILEKEVILQKAIIQRQELRQVSPAVRHLGLEKEVTSHKPTIQRQELRQASSATKPRGLQTHRTPAPQTPLQEMPL
jgi:N12 class adenine-specific DNA methylase